MRAVGMATAGQPQKAVQFLCKSFTGKSTILKSLVSRTNAEAERGTMPIFYLELASSTTPNQLWEQMLVALGDGLGGKGRNEAQRFSRVCALLAQSGVTLIIFDEIQHLISHETERVAWRVTEAIKRLLNAGIAPIVLSGDLSADALFKRNPQLRNRMRVPLQLPPLDYANPDDTGYASVFLDRLDQHMVDTGIMHARSNLGAGQIPSALCMASEGALGTACNIVREALQIALSRNARKISAEDIAEAIDCWAIPQGFCKSNPLTA